MKRNTKIALVMMALSAMAMGSTSAFAHGGHGMWQQNAAPFQTFVDLFCFTSEGQLQPEPCQPHCLRILRSS